MLITKKLKSLEDHPFRAHQATILDDKRIFAMTKGIIDTLKLYECTHDNSAILDSSNIDKELHELVMRTSFHNIIDSRKLYEVSMGEKSNICAVFTYSHYESVKNENQALGFYPVIRKDGYDLSPIADAFYVGLPVSDRNLIEEHLGYLFEDVYDHSQADKDGGTLPPPKEIAIIIYINERFFDERI